MEKELEKMITEIHESDLFGTFIETGAGIGLAESMFKVGGASNTVHMTMCPYSREVATKFFGDSGHRAVSFETVRHILEKTWEDVKDACNSIYVNSFQVHTEPDKTSHGWIGYRAKNGITMYYHISLPQGKTREEYVNMVGMIGVKIVHSMNEGVLKECYIDNLVDCSGKTLMIYLLKHFNNSEDTYLFFDDNGQAGRLEDFIRGKEEISIYKGSFNPIHKKHAQIFEASTLKAPDADPYFMISLNTYQKGIVNIRDVAFRIDMLNALGYKVIINSDGFFKNNVETLGARYRGKINFILGVDTANRILQDYILDDNLLEQEWQDSFPAEIVKFLYVDRDTYETHRVIEEVDQFVKICDNVDNVNATEVRKWMSEGDFNKVREQVPLRVAEMIERRN